MWAKILAFLKRIPILGWIAMGLGIAVLAFAQAWRSATNEAKRISVKFKLSKAKRNLEKAIFEAEKDGILERTEAQIEYETEVIKLDQTRREIMSSDGPSLSDKINEYFKGGRNA